MDDFELERHQLLAQYLTDRCNNGDAEWEVTVLDDDGVRTVSSRDGSPHHPLD